MARAPKGRQSQASEAPSTDDIKSNLPVDWEAQMELDARIAADMEARVGSSNFFSTRGGVLKYNDAPLPDNQMVVIVLDHIIEKTFYAEDFDPDAPVSPVCFAFGRGDELDLVPHDDSEDKQHSKCDGCPNNEFGTANRGSGKACKDARRLAVIGAGAHNARDNTFDIQDDPEYYATQQVGLLRLPPTSLKSWATYVKQLAGVLKRPPYGVVTLIKVVPDPKNQFTFTFTMLDRTPAAVMPAVLEKRKYCQTPGIVDVAYRASSHDEDSPPARGGRKQAAGRGAANARGAKPAAGRARKY